MVFRIVKLAAAAAIAAFAHPHALGGAPVRPQDRLMQADKERDAGMHKEAFSDYSALIGEPGVAQDRLFLRIAGVCESLGRKNDARMAYERAARLGGDGETADYARLRLTEYDAGESRIAALRALADAARAPSVRAAALYRLGAALEAGSPAAAVSAYDRLLAMTNAPAGYNAYAGLRKAAILSASPAAAGREKAMQAYRALLADPAAPSNAVENAAYYAGHLSFREGKHAEACAFFDKLERSFPGGPLARSAAVPHAWAAYLCGRDADAIAIAEKNAGGRSGEEASMLLYIKAGALRRTARNEEAAAAYARILRNPGGFTLLRETKTAYLETKHALGDNAGIAAFAKEHAKSPDDLPPRGWCMVCDAAAAAGDRAGAIRAARAARDGGTNEWSRLGAMRLGKALSESGSHVQAAAAYREAAQKWRGERDFAADALLMAGAEELRAGNAQDAMREWTAVVRDFDGAPAVPEAMYRRGILELRASEWRRAQDAFDELNSRFPANKFLADALHWSGVAAGKAGNAALAEKRHRAALAANPSPALAADIHLALGALLRESGRVEEAAAEYAATLDSSASADVHPSILVWLAEESLKMKNLSVARDALRALAAKPQDDGWRQAGLAVSGDVLEAAGDAEAARRAREEAVALPAKTVYAARAALALGASHARAGDAANARKWFLEAAARSESDDALKVRARAWHGLARVERDAGNYEEARRWFTLATTLPDDPEMTRQANEGAAEMLDKLGNHAAAAKFRADAAKAGGAK